MPTDLPDAEIKNKLRVLQVIILALLSGATTFAVLAMFIPVGTEADGASGRAADVNVLRYVWLASAVFAIASLFVVRIIIPRAAVAQQGGDQAPPHAVMQAYFIASILTGAMLEGASILGSIVLLLGEQPLDLALALAPLVIMLPFFPTTGRFERFTARLTGKADPERGLRAPRRDFKSYR